MTLWQDEPPQTRRQARERERERQKAIAETVPPTSRRAATVEPTPGGEIPAVTTPFGFSDRREAESRDEAAKASALRDGRGLPPSRPKLPTYGGSFDALLVTPRDEDPEAAIAESAEAEVEVAEVEATEPETDEAESLYRETPPTDASEPVTTPVALIPAAALLSSPPIALPAVTTPPAERGESAAPERTLTRRELRAMLQAQEANQFAGDRSDAVVEPVAPPTYSGPPVFAPDEPAELGRSAEPDALADLFAAQDDNEADEAESDAPAELPAGAAPPTAWPLGPLTPTPAEPERVASVDAEPAPHAEEPSRSEPEAPVAYAPFGLTSAEPTESASSPAVSAADEDSSRQPYQPPVGHWSTAEELDDKNQPFDQIISRSVGPSGAATTTNALILPVVPSAPDATGPLTSTGEILVTGSIDLPRGFGATGQHPDRYDSSDMDRMFEQDENEFNTSGVAPIRASRAVSTHTSTRGVITPPKKRGGRLPVVLSITAAILAIGVVGLLVAGYILKVF